MKKVWKSWLKDSTFLYCIIYTVVTIVNSIAYLAAGTYYDPSVNGHEIDRALLVLIGVMAYEMSVIIPVRNTLVRMLVTYVPTMMLCFFYVCLTGFREPLASSAYRDIFINYTGLFFIISIAAVIFEKKRERQLHSV